MVPFLYLETVDSTNTYAAEHFNELADGTLIQAGTQTGGRGRLNRVWSSPEGNLYASYVMKDIHGDAFLATIASSLAVLAAVRDVTPGVDAWIKWPNDVFVRDKKLCGILCESVIRHGALQGIICGIGVNVNMPEKMLKDIGQPATSLSAETKSEINLKFFAKKLAIYLRWYYITGISFKEKLFDQWRQENRLIGQTADFKSADGSFFQAEVLGIDDEGRLRIRRNSGTEELFTCGDVKIVFKH